MLKMEAIEAEWRIASDERLLVTLDFLIPKLVEVA